MFTKDSRTETFLNQMGVEFTYSNSVTFGRLCAGWENKNLARPVPIREEAVLEYSTLMLSGSPAPAPILFYMKDGKLDVLDGVQRLAAAQLASSTNIAAYIVKCDSPIHVIAIRVLANARLQGRQEPAEWTRRRAVEVLVLQKGLSHEEVARMGGWTVKQIESTAKILAWDKTITGIGGPSFPDTMINTISSCTEMDEIMRCQEPIASFLNLIKQAKFSTADAAPYLSDFFKKVTKPSKRRLIYSDRLESFKSCPEVVVRIKGRKGTELKNDILLRRSLKTTITILDEMVSDCQTVVYVDEFFKLLHDIEKRLKKLTKNPSPVEVRVPADKWVRQ